MSKEHEADPGSRHELRKKRVLDKKVTCAQCGRIMRRGDVPFMMRRLNGARFFCTPDCVARFQHKETFLEVSSILIIISVLAAVLLITAPWSYFTPVEKPKYAPSMDPVGNRDIIFKDVRAHGDGYQTNVEVEILLTNRGKGSTGPLFIDVFAENDTSKVIDSTFNTSVLHYIDNGSTGSILPPMKSAKVNGVLVLLPGTHNIYFRVYECGLRGFIEGQRIIKVTQDQIVMQPWDQGGSRSEPYSPGTSAKKGTTPGFEAPVLIIAVMAVILFVKMKRSKK